MAKCVAYLIGSGLSIPFGMPSLNELDRFIMSNNDAFWHTDQHFYVHPQIRDTCSYSQIKPSTIRAYLQTVKKSIAQYYSALGYETKITYEDVYDYLVQFSNVLDSEYENPIMDQNVLRQVTQHNISSKRYNKWMRKIQGSIVYISDMVIYKLLSRLPSNQLDSILSDFLLLDLHEVQKLVFTLNHDTIIDDFLLAKQVDYYDGFKPQPIVQCFDVKSLYENNCEVKYVKLHGSINYYSSAGKVIKTYDRNYSPDGNIVYGPMGSAYLNIGKTVKILNYNQHFFGSLATYFDYALTNNVDTLVIVGYGFNDKGINNLLANWFYQSGNKHIIVVHPNRDELISTARGAAQRVLENLSRVVFIEKKFEDLDKDIQQLLM